MNKLKSYFINKFVDYKLKQLAKTKFTASNTYTTHWKETGDKTCGRINMFETVNYAMIKVYGFNWNFLLRINGLNFTDDENGICLHVMTHRPSKLIGKCGEKINELEKILSLVFIKDTRIDIEETEELDGFVTYENY